MDDEAEKFLGNETVPRKVMCAETVQVKNKLESKRKYYFVISLCCALLLQPMVQLQVACCIGSSAEIQGRQVLDNLSLD